MSLLMFCESSAAVVCIWTIQKHYSDVIGRFDLNVEQLLFQSPAWSESSIAAKKNVFILQNRQNSW